VTYVRRSGRFHNPGTSQFAWLPLTSTGANTDWIVQQFETKVMVIRTATVEKIGGGAGNGTIIGAIVGRGRGALLGGLLGAGAGTGVAAATGKKPTEFPADSVYNFSLTSSAELHT
jgi:hypothetical protein